ncbi:hypothetical protein ACJIZ3_003582 [Penstemon smallii]|uniref:COI1 F-box domain-containing protein n=1 Tax=Penstemon smallii TaxID=265156 RepID=A0ABD3U9M0_9LAMI
MYGERGEANGKKKKKKKKKRKEGTSSNVITSIIIAAVSSPRSRNSAALVCHIWYILERSTRSSLTLRGNLRDLFMLPTCFSSISHLDISLLSPWGHPLTSTTDPPLIAHLLRHLLLPNWHNIKHLRLVRWHQRPQIAAPGEELQILFSECGGLNWLDLSSFYCWTDDVPPALQAYPLLASNLTCLNLLNPSFSEGFKWMRSREFRAASMFDPRYIGFVGDEGLVSVSVNCPKLVILHLADTSALSNCRGDPDNEAFTQEDAGINVATLIEVFSLLEDLALDVCNNVRESGPALEVLNSKCPKLRSLKLGQFHGISMPIESKLEGVALCQGLESLSIRNVGDLTDMGLIAIARGCCRLAKFDVHGCKKITIKGMRTLASLLKRTLVDVKISCCKNLDRIKRLHIDCVCDTADEVDDGDGFGGDFDLDNLDEGELDNKAAYFTSSLSDYDEMSNPSKNCKYSYDLNSCYMGLDDNGNEYENVNVFGPRTWERLQYLSLWIAVGHLLTPLIDAGLENCPNLEEIKIKVEGDCRELPKPTEREFGLSILVNYPQLSKTILDCSDTIGYAHTAPSGQMDLSLWERFYLFGIGHLNLKELDYWPPQDRDVNQRSLSLPAAGLLQECIGVRKLFIHGTAHEHFMMFLLRIPELRDEQLREDFYPIFD